MLKWEVIFERALTTIEEVEAIVELVDVDLIEDAELIEDKQYASMGKNPADRVKTLVGKLHSITNSKNRGSQVSKKADLLLYKFVQQVDEIFKNFLKPLEWRYFYLRDLPILMDINEEVREVSNQNHLNREQTSALKKLDDVSPQEFQKVTANGRKTSKSMAEPEIKDSSQVGLKDLGAK